MSNNIVYCLWSTCNTLHVDEALRARVLLHTRVCESVYVCTTRSRRIAQNTFHVHTRVSIFSHGTYLRTDSCQHEKQK